MQFTSFQFAVFFPTVVLMYYIMPRKLRQLWLLVASYYFYMGWNAMYALLILASTVITYLGGMLIDKTNANNKGRRRLYLVVCLLLNLGILVFFKYFYFLRDIVAGIVSLFGIKMGASRLDILLPVGISFYTFQALGYTIDVYRGDVKAEKNIVRYALFVSFFPQLVAGPIERSGHLLSQIEKVSHEKSWDFDMVTRGLLMMLWGFFMKMVIADRAAVLVNQVYEYYYMMNGVALTLAAVLFVVQIYCDFASYSAIAAGAAGVLGIELMANFRAPLLSGNIAQLWRRWHISLSSWFRDYLYIPLGGNRHGKLRKYFNSLVTFSVSGLWHGANWSYVIWGILQSVFIIIGDITKPFKDRFNSRFNVRVNTVGYRLFQVVCTFSLFMLSMIFFRADTISEALHYIQRMFTTFDVWSLFDESVFNLGLERKEMHVLIAGIIMLTVVDAYCILKNKFFDSLVKEQCLAVQYVIVVAVLVMVIIFGVYGEGYDASQFIYFQF